MATGIGSSALSPAWASIVVSSANPSTVSLMRRLATSCPSALTRAMSWCLSVQSIPQYIFNCSLSLRSGFVLLARDLGENARRPNDEALWLSRRGVRSRSLLAARFRSSRQNSLVFE